MAFLRAQYSRLMIKRLTQDHVPAAYSAITFPPGAPCVEFIAGYLTRILNLVT